MYYEDNKDKIQEYRKMYYEDNKEKYKESVRNIKKIIKIKFEEKNILWIALNSVGLIKYDISNDKWETYTTENSNVPSIHVMQLTKDKNGTIWGATFSGLIKLNAE